MLCHSSYTFTVKNDVLAVEKEENIHISKHNIIVFVLVLIITAFVFYDSLKLDWTNWDDNFYVYENPMVHDARLKDIFSKPADYNTYNPLVISFFAFEWKLVKDKPFLYHLNNYLLHILCVALVLYYFKNWDCRYGGAASERYFLGFIPCGWNPLRG